MKINTSRFGRIEIEPSDVLHFPSGLWGFEECKDWVILSDQENSALAWLQSVDQPSVALAVASPRRFVPTYKMHLAKRELTLLGLTEARQARVLVIVGHTNRAITLNLKAPVLINLERRLGRQVITNGELPIQFELIDQLPAMKKSA
jgi:flagellar assembly factor FliW